MIELSTIAVEQVAAPPLAPVEQAIDLAHFSRMTFGDRSLEREILQLFDRQSEILLARMRQCAPSAAGAFAHTLKGSSRSIGAVRMGNAAEAVELAAATGNVAEVKAAIDCLGKAIDEVRIMIAELLRAH